jgi:hypothetical protein
MHTAEARVVTDRGDRYVNQLCGHLGRMPRPHHVLPHGPGAAAMPRVTGVERTPGRAVVRFTEGTWTLQEAPGALLLRLEAPDHTALTHLQAAITARLTTIGRREGLTLAWDEDASPSA